MADRAPKERPILFSGPMVKAILEGRKTQTRRVAREAFDPQPCPYGDPGDLLWVKEAHAFLRALDGGDLIAYRATCDDDAFDYVARDGSIRRIEVHRWRPSIHMPRWASRLTLRVTEVRVQRLQDTSEEDARAEGVTPLQMDDGSFLPSFEGSWNSINAKRGFGWDVNPWVWAITFERVS